MVSFRRWVIAFVIFWGSVCVPGLEAALDYQVKASIVYVEKTDTLRFLLWLEKRGILVTNQTSPNDILGPAELYISDLKSGGWQEALPVAAPSTGGVYTLDIPDVTTKGTPKLEKGATYFARCLIHYGGGTGMGQPYQTVTTFTITVEQTLLVVTQHIAGINSNVQGQVIGVKPLIASEGNTTRQSMGEVKAQAREIVTATEKTLTELIRTRTDAVKTQVQTAAKSQILNRETTTSLGSTVMIRYRTYEKASPAITVYDPENVRRVFGARMKEVVAGIYEYPVTFATAWPTGDYTVTCSEASYGTMDAITISVLLADVEGMAADVSAILSNASSPEDLKFKLDVFRAALRLIEENLQSASEALAIAQGDPLAVAGVAEQLASLYNSLNDVSFNVEALGVTAAFDVKKLYAMDAQRARDIVYLCNKTQELKAILSLNQQLLKDTAKEEALIQTWMIFR